MKHEDIVLRKTNGLEDVEFSLPNAMIPQMKVSMALKQRKICLYDIVNDEMATEVVYFLNKLMAIDEMTGEKKPVELLINSSGGCVDSGVVIVNMIEHMKSDGYKIITTNMSNACSMAFVISILGNERRSYKYSRYMYHDLSGGSVGTYVGLKENLKEMEHVKKMIDSIIISNTHIKDSDIEYWNNSKYDKFFSAQEAVEIGVCDIIL